MAYPSRPGNTPTVACGARRNQGNLTDVNINVPAMHDQSSCHGSRS